MLSERIETLSSLTELYDRAKNDLDRIRNEYTNDEILLSMYESSALKLVKLIQSEIMKTLHLEEPLNQSVDVWIKLEGPELEAEQIPVGVLGKFLQGLSVANKHAVSIIECLKHEQGRFNQKVHDLAEFSLVLASPGSIQIGVRKPSVERFLPKDYASDQPKLFESYDLQTFIKAQEQSERAIEGLSLLLRTIEAADEQDEILLLQQEVGQKNVLRLLYHARELTPSQRGAYTMVSVSGKALSNKTLKFDLNTREKLKFVSKELLDNERYIKAFGRIRMVDIDKRIIKARPFYAEDFYVEEIEGKLSDQITDRDFELIINKPVLLSGLVVLSETGEIRYLEIDDIELSEMDT